MMKNKEGITLISLIVIILVLLCVVITAILFITKDSSTNNEEPSIDIQNNNSLKDSVDSTEFISNLKKYYTGEKSANITLKVTSESGTVTSKRSTTNDLEEQDIIITDNSITAKIAGDDIVYEYNYKITEDRAYFTIQKENPSEYEKLILVGSINNLCTLFVAYSELLGVEPNMALAYYQFANSKENAIHDDGILIKNEIFVITETMDDNNNYYYQLEINNENMPNISELLKNEQKKQTNIIYVE